MTTGPRPPYGMPYRPVLSPYETPYRLVIWEVGTRTFRCRYKNCSLSDARDGSWCSTDPSVGYGLGMEANYSASYWCECGTTGDDYYGYLSAAVDTS